MTEKQKAVLAKTIGTICVCGFFLVLSRGLWKDAASGSLSSRSAVRILESASESKTTVSSSALQSEPEQPSHTSVSKQKTSKTKKSTARQASASASGAAESEGIEVSFPLNLNTATVEELTALDGVGTVLAERIVAYREACGGFSNRMQLLEVSGIGEQKLAAIYDFLYLDEEQPLEDEEDGETAWETEQPADWEDVPAESMPDAAEELEPIDLNQATLADLMQIPDMSEALAEQILALREEITAFQSVYELLYAEGMTTERWKAICLYVTVNP